MQKSIAKDPELAAQVAEVLKAIAHPLRVRIIAVLVDGPQHVNALAEMLDAKQAVVSQQLRILRMRSLVSVARENGFAYYRLAEPNLQQMIQCMEGCRL
ncbi:MAG: winged helix-turn-helix transcriptional regulator [Deltaproteobacteria bacterium]|nr:winged helix-turn-helix transcriptional regulator [Deltaproteobacteria bacterium]